MKSISFQEQLEINGGIVCGGLCIAGIVAGFILVTSFIDGCNEAAHECNDDNDCNDPCNP